MGNITEDGEQTFPDAMVRIGEPYYLMDEDGKTIRPFYLCTLVTTNGQIWMVRWNAPSVTEEQIRHLWHTEAELFTRYDPNAKPVPPEPESEK